MGRQSDITVFCLRCELWHITSVQLRQILWCGTGLADMIQDV